MSPVDKNSYCDDFYEHDDNDHDDDYIHEHGHRDDDKNHDDFDNWDEDDKNELSCLCTDFAFAAFCNLSWICQNISFLFGKPEFDLSE